jgi:hypothetical protein
MAFGDGLQNFGAGVANLVGGLGSGIQDVTGEIIEHRTAVRQGRFAKNTANKLSRRQFQAAKVDSRQYGKVGVAEATGRRWGQSYAERGHLLAQTGIGAQIGHARFGMPQQGPQGDVYNAAPMGYQPQPEAEGFLDEYGPVLLIGGLALAALKMSGGNS